MNGMPSAEVISLSCPATSIWSCSDSTTQGPAIKKKGLERPTSKPQSFMSGDRLELLSGRRLVLQRGLDEGVEEGVSVPRGRLELGVELHAHEPGVHVLGQLHDLGQVLALGEGGDHQA